MSETENNSTPVVGATEVVEIAKLEKESSSMDTKYASASPENQAQAAPTTGTNTFCQYAGNLIDNGYTGWGGSACIRWPERDLQLTLAMPNFMRDGGPALHYCLVYRPPQGPAFCFEPITHPIDAFHLAGTPGLHTLGAGESLSLEMHWRFAALGDGR